MPKMTMMEMVMLVVIPDDGDGDDGGSDGEGDEHDDDDADAGDSDDRFVILVMKMAMMMVMVMTMMMGVMVFHQRNLNVTIVSPLSDYVPRRPHDSQVSSFLVPSSALSDLASSTATISICNRYRGSASSGTIWW